MHAGKLPKISERSEIKEVGFSLVELLIAVVIASILLAVAVPSFQSLMTQNKLTATTNTMVFSLQAARSEAIKQALPAGVCSSNNSLEADARCSQGSGYVGGWIAYVDDNSNGTRDGGEDIVMAVEDRGAGFTITPDNAFQSQVYFDETGGSTNPSGVPLSGEISLSYTGGSEKKIIQVSVTGRVSTVAQ